MGFKQTLKTVTYKYKNILLKSFNSLSLFVCKNYLKCQKRLRGQK